MKRYALAAVKASVAEAEASELKELRSKKEKNIGDMPNDVLEYMALERDVKIKGEVYLNLVKQSEQSKIQEAMDSMDIQIVDPANLPDVDKPVAPRKKLITAIGFVIGVLLSMGYGLFMYRRTA